MECVHVTALILLPCVHGGERCEHRQAGERMTNWRGWKQTISPTRPLVWELSLWVSPGHAELGRRATQAAEGKVRLKVTASNPSNSDQLRLAIIMGVRRRKEGNQVGNAMNKVKGC